ncbi:MAG: NUDIX hydrolase [Desulfobacterales bacterium]
MTAKLNRRECIYQGRAFHVFRDNITLENGSTVNMDVVRHPGAAAMVAITADNNTILMLKQYRYVVGGYIWEIPAGTLDPGEAPLDCAKRELIEETGMNAASWKKLGDITPAPGYTDERIHLYLARDLMPASQKLDRNEILDVHRIDFDAAMEMIRSGRIADAKTITGIYLVKDLLNL